MDNVDRLAPAALDEVLDALLETERSGIAMAFRPDGVLLPMPASVPLRGQQVHESGASVLEMVVPDDVMTALATWDRLLHTGIARGVVRLLADPSEDVAVHAVDAMHSHGAYIVVLVPQSERSAVTAPRLGSVRPRVVMFRKDERGVVLDCDDAAIQLLGWTREELIGRRSLELVDPSHQAVSVANWMDLLRSPGERRRVRLRHRHRDGSWVWFDVTNHNLLDSADHGYILSEMVDITDEMAVEEALRAREQLVRRLTEALPLGVMQLDVERRIVYRNERLPDVLAAPAALRLDDQLASVVTAHRDAFRCAVDAALTDGTDGDLEVSVRREHRGLRRCAVAVRALDDGAGTVTGAIVCVTDVTDSVRLREELEVRATIDALTGCRTRASILALLQDQLDLPGRAGTGVIFVDLDGFKGVNDQFGHSAGDELLTAAAARMLGCIRGNDAVGRLGGDEFLVVCTNVDGPGTLDAVAQRLSASLHGPVRLSTGEVLLAASIGAAWVDGTGCTPEDLVARADAAMYAAKRQGDGAPVLADA